MLKFRQDVQAYLPQKDARYTIKMKFAIVSMEMGLLINWLVDVISNSTNVSGHCLHHKTYVKFLNF